MIFILYYKYKIIHDFILWNVDSVILSKNFFLIIRIIGNIILMSYIGEVDKLKSLKFN